MSPHSSPAPERPGLFIQTPWPAVTYNARARASRRQLADEHFCREYWKPIFELIMRRGYGFADAQDLTQDFVLYFLASGALSRAHPSKGRFRDYLCASLRHYLFNQQARARTQKRGGHLVAVGLEAIAELPAPAPPDSDAGWRDALVARALDSLRARYREKRRALFDALHPYLLSEEGKPPYVRLACRLHRTPATLRSEMKRLREYFHAEVRHQMRGEIPRDSRNGAAS